MSKKKRVEKPKWSKWNYADQHDSRKGLARERNYETKNFEVSQRQVKQDGNGNNFRLVTSTFYSEKRK